MEYIYWFLWFVIYSFVGWAYESALVSIREWRPVNRGFLNGPVCPIYGFGAVAVLFTLDGRIHNVALLFLAAAVLTCTLEYITAVLMEKLFHAKWWDYSNLRFNIKGRVSLAGALVFGLLCVLLIEFIHPFVRSLTYRVPDGALIGVSAAIFAVLALDTIFTVRHILVLNGRLDEIQCAINGFVAQQTRRAEELRSVLAERFENSDFYNEHIQALLQRNHFQSHRLMRAFPKLRFVRNEDAFTKLKETIKRVKDKRD